MFPVSVKNLYIGKTDLKFFLRESNGIRLQQPTQIDPTTLVGELFSPIKLKPDKYSPDYYLKGIGWDFKQVTIPPRPKEDLFTVWITGIPLHQFDIGYVIKDNLVYRATYQDEKRIYLIQVTRETFNNVVTLKA